MALDLGATLALNAIVVILILSISALGLAIIFGFMGVINLAHGSFLAIGAYVAWLTTTTLGIGFWPSLVIAPIVVGFVGYLCEVFIIRYLYERLFDTILATWGIALVIQEAIKLVFGTTTKSVANPLGGGVNLGVTTYPAYRLFLIVFCLVMIISVIGVFRVTLIGTRMRAVIQDAESATLVGINEKRMNQLAFAFGAALAGLAGAAIAPITPVEPMMGITYLVQSFFAIILGGTGSLVGVVAGSTVVAGPANLLSFSISPVIAQTIVYLFVIVIMVIRPQGIVPEGWHD